MEINVDVRRCLCAFHFRVSMCIFTFLILRRRHLDIVINVRSFSCEVPVIPDRI
jgi:hypothetical protein